MRDSEFGSSQKSMGKGRRRRKKRRRRSWEELETHLKHPKLLKLLSPFMANGPLGMAFKKQSMSSCEAKERAQGYQKNNTHWISII